jgi:hypothetical protein
LHKSPTPERAISKSNSSLNNSQVSVINGISSLPRGQPPIAEAENMEDSETVEVPIETEKAADDEEDGVVIV